VFGVCLALYNPDRLILKIIRKPTPFSTSTLKEADVWFFVCREQEVNPANISIIYDE